MAIMLRFGSAQVWPARRETEYFTEVSLRSTLLLSSVCSFWVYYHPPMAKIPRAPEVSKGEIMMYQSQSGKTTLDVRLENESVWLTQRQMSDLFGKDTRTVSEHIVNIFKEGELERKSVIRNFRITASDGKVYDTSFYNLDVIISVGYRVHSKRGTQFRQWASKVLRDHLIKGFSFNQKRLHEKGIQEFEEAVALMKRAVKQKQLTSDEAKGLLHVIADYAKSWLLLEKFDEGFLEVQGSVKEVMKCIAHDEAEESLALQEKRREEN